MLATQSNLKKKKDEKGTLNREGLKKWDMVTLFKFYQSNESERDPPDWTTAQRTQWHQILKRQRPRNSSQPSFLHLCVKSPESTNQKNQRKKVKNYTFTVEEIVCFHLWYTKYVQSHAEDCLHERPERPVCLLPFLTCVNHKSAAKSPLSVSHSPG